MRFHCVIRGCCIAGSHHSSLAVVPCLTHSGPGQRQGAVQDRRQGHAHQRLLRGPGSSSTTPLLSGWFVSCRLLFGCCCPLLRSAPSDGFTHIDWCSACCLVVLIARADCQTVRCLPSIADMCPFACGAGESQAPQVLPDRGHQRPRYVHTLASSVSCCGVLALATLGLRLVYPSPGCVHSSPSALVFRFGPSSFTGLHAR